MSQQSDDKEINKENQETVLNTDQEDAREPEPVKEESTSENKIAELNDKYLRLYAEYDNFRKRTARERIDYLNSAGEDIFKAFLPMADDFERAIKANEKVEDITAVKEGFQLIFNKLKNILKQKNVEVMESTGKEFNPETMEAITNIPAPSDDMKGKVVDEVEKGYILNGKVIRFAKVVVGA